MKDFTIRPYDPSRWEMRMGLQGVASAIWGKEDFRHGVFIFEPSATATHNILVAYIDDKEVGYSISHYRDTEKDWRFHTLNPDGVASLKIDEIAVLPDYRFLGIGGSLGRGMITRSRVNQCAIMQATTHDIAQRLFYQKLGFTRVINGSQYPTEQVSEKGSEVAFWELLLPNSSARYREMSLADESQP